MMMKVIMIIKHFSTQSFSIGLDLNQIGFCTLTYLRMNKYIGTKMIDSDMKKYMKKGSQPVQEFRSEMYAKQRDGETCVDEWQQIKRNVQGIRSEGRTIETMDLADALTGSLHPEHVHSMIIVDTSSVTLHELEDKVLTMGQHVDQVLSGGSSAHS